MICYMNNRERKFWMGAANVSASMIISLTIFTGAVTGFFLLTRNWWRKYQTWDMKVFEMLEPCTNEQNNKVMLGITYLGKHQFLVPAHLALIAYFLLIRKRTWF